MRNEFNSMMSFDPFQASIGYDRMFDRMNRIVAELNGDSIQKYPPYNIVKVNDNTFDVEVAVAGFMKDELDVSVTDGVLVITGSSLRDSGGEAYIHKGIGMRDFVKKFTLADTIKVIGADIHNGLLKVRCENVIPETAKPIQISIGGIDSLAGSKEPEFLTE